VAETPEASEADIVDLEPMPTVDPTAELLGTAKRKRTARTRQTAATTAAAGPRTRARSAARTPAKRRRGRDAHGDASCLFTDGPATELICNARSKKSSPFHFGWRFRKSSHWFTSATCVPPAFA